MSFLRRSAKRTEVGSSNKRYRDMWLERQLRALRSGTRLLDAGAGECANRKFCAHLDYVSQDFNAYSGQGDGRGLQTGSWNVQGVDVVSDIVCIPEPDASFDAVLCTEVLEHVPEALSALRELVRLLKPGGVLLLTAPFASLTHFAPYHFYSGFNRYFYEEHLPALGLEVEELVENGNYFEWLAQELRRLDHVAERYAGSSLSLLERWYRGFLLGALGRFSAADSGSAELLCFGIHVRARKQL